MIPSVYFPARLYNLCSVFYVEIAVGFQMKISTRSTKLAGRGFSLLNCSSLFSWANISLLTDSISLNPELPTPFEHNGGHCLTLAKFVPTSRLHPIGFQEHRVNSVGWPKHTSVSNSHNLASPTISHSGPRRTQY